MTIGDVLAAVAALAILGVGLGATLLVAALVFSQRTRRVAEAITAAPGRCLGVGTFAVLAVGLFAVVLGHSPAGPVRLLGHALWACLGLAAALGGAGIVRLVGERIETVGTQMSSFASLTRGTALCVLAGFLPIIGWFLVTPLAAIIALGGLVRSRQGTPHSRREVASLSVNATSVAPEAAS